jgi:hypothetical protein
VLTPTSHRYLVLTYLNSALTAGIHNTSNTSLTLLSKEASAVSHTTTKAANACQQYTLKVLSCRNSFNISVWLGIKIIYPHLCLQT